MPTLMLKNWRDQGILFQVMMRAGVLTVKGRGLSIATPTCSPIQLCCVYWHSSCAASACPPLTAPANGDLLLSNENLIGSRASYSCDPGFTFRSGDFIFRECMATGVWSNSEPACIGKLPTSAITFARTKQRRTQTLICGTKQDLHTPLPA
jgi:hypothetical protein